MGSPVCKSRTLPRNKIGVVAESPAAFCASGNVMAISTMKKRSPNENIACLNQRIAALGMQI
jgi:hypothetical protein